MAVSTVNVLHGIANGSTFLSQISNARATPGVELVLAQASGMPYDQFVGNIGTNPGVSFDCTQLKTLLDLTGALTSIVDLSAANTDLLYKKASDLGRRVADATTEHTRLRAAQAWLAIESITASHRGIASAACRLGTTYDGTNAPIVPAGSVALSGTPTAATHWVAGPVVLNTVALPGVQDITIDFGRSIVEAGGEGELYNTHVHLEKYAPVVTIRVLTHAWATYGIVGTALTAADFYLRKLATTGRVADATEEHLKFSATRGIVTVDDTSTGAVDPAITTVRCTLVGADASTEPITLDTTAAIS